MSFEDYKDAQLGKPPKTGTDHDDYAAGLQTRIAGPHLLGDAKKSWYSDKSPGDASEGGAEGLLYLALLPAAVTVGAAWLLYKFIRFAGPPVIRGLAVAGRWCVKNPKTAAAITCAVTVCGVKLLTPYNPLSPTSWWLFGSHMIKGKTTTQTGSTYQYEKEPPKSPNTYFQNVAVNNDYTAFLSTTASYKVDPHDAETGLSFAQSLFVGLWDIDSANIQVELPSGQKQPTVCDTWLNARTLDGRSGLVLGSLLPVTTIESSDGSVALPEFIENKGIKDQGVYYKKGIVPAYRCPPEQESTSSVSQKKSNPQNDTALENLTSCARYYSINNGEDTRLELCSYVIDQRSKALWAVPLTILMELSSAVSDGHFRRSVTEVYDGLCTLAKDHSLFYRKLAKVDPSKIRYVKSDYLPPDTPNYLFSTPLEEHSSISLVPNQCVQSTVIKGYHPDPADPK